MVRVMVDSRGCTSPYKKSMEHMLCYSICAMQQKEISVLDFAVSGVYTHIHTHTHIIYQPH